KRHRDIAERTDLGKAENYVAFDIATDGNTLFLLFYGVPSAKTEVTVIGPPKWEKHLPSDDQGRIDMAAAWSGRYVLEVTHFEAKAGSSGNEKFDRTRHISSLSFTHQSGIKWTEKP